MLLTAAAKINKKIKKTEVIKKKLNKLIILN
jgi:hypothetical protein